MARVEAKLEEMGLELPEPVKAPPGVRVPFAWVRVRGDRAYASGHAALNEDGSRPLARSARSGRRCRRLRRLTWLPGERASRYSVL